MQTYHPRGIEFGRAVRRVGGRVNREPAVGDPELNPAEEQLRRGDVACESANIGAVRL